MMRDESELHDRFERAARAAGARGNVDATFFGLVRRYCEPHRHYHTLAHVDACLTWLDWYAGSAQRWEEVALALWFHDAIYDPKANDNEARSAELTRVELTALGLTTACVERIASYVEATAHHQGSGDAALVVAIDLTILAAEYDVFTAFEREIRGEYAHVPEEAFRLGRRKVLQGFLARPQIYPVPCLRDALEARARRNLERRIGELTAAGPSA
jgi:predicted metal-dependent HD superfamily phosphohydrolase